MEKSSATIKMNCEEAVCNEEKICTLESEIETVVDSLAKAEESAANNIMECGEGIHVEASVLLDESNETEQANSATKRKKSSSADQSDQNSAAKKDSIEKEDACQNLSSVIQSDANATNQAAETEMDTATDRTVVSRAASSEMDLKEKKSEQDATSNLPTKESCTTGQTNSQALRQKPVKIIKRVALLKTNTAPGKFVNIKILSKDEKNAKSLTVATSGSSQTPVKNASSPNIVNRLAVKKPPIILPKPQSLSNSTESTVLSSSSPSPSSRNLRKVLVPKNYVLVQTSTGFSFALADQVQNGVLKKTNPSNTGFVNVRNTGKLSHSRTNVSQRGGVSIQKPSFSATEASCSQGIIAKSQSVVTSDSSCSFTSSTISSSGLLMNSNRNKVGSARDHTDAKKILDPDGCRHPTCCTYREKVYEELREKFKNRLRKIKSTRMAKLRCVKRVITQMTTIKSLQRQRSIHKSLESLPDGLVKTLMWAQLNPREAVRAKRQYEEQLKAFAIQLNLISPQAYDYVRSIFHRILPKSESVHSWNFGREEDVVQDVDESQKAASTDEEEEEGERAESNSDEEMLEEERDES